MKTVALTLIALILCLNVAKQSKEISALLIIATICILLSFAATTYIQPFVTFIEQMQEIGKLDTQMIKILLKATGIGILTEIVCLICSDSGYSTLGKTLKLISVFLILWLSLPLMNSLLTLIDSILSNL